LTFKKKICIFKDFKNLSVAKKGLITTCSDVDNLRTQKN